MMESIRAPSRNTGVIPAKAGTQCTGHESLLNAGRIHIPSET
jgi:hypothetical protein